MCPENKVSIFQGVLRCVYGCVRVRDLHPYLLPGLWGKRRFLGNSWDDVHASVVVSNLGLKILAFLNQISAVKTCLFIHLCVCCVCVCVCVCVRVCVVNAMMLMPYQFVAQAR